MAKKLRYLNANCLGDGLTVNSSNSFNAKFVHNSYIQFYKDTDYIFFGHRDQFKDSKYFASYGVYSFNLSNTTSGMLYIGQNLVYNQTADLWVSQASYDFTNKKYIIILSNNKQYETATVSIGAWTNQWGIALSDNGTPHIWNMGAELTLTQVADSTNTYDEFTYVNAIKIADENVQPSNGPTFLPIWTLTWRQGTKQATTHFFRLAEGVGNPYVYDDVGDVIGRYYVASQVNSWRFDGFKIAYNTVNGFSCDEGFLQYSERIPYGKELCIYKSDFTKTVDNWFKEKNMEGEIVIDASKNILKLTNNTYTPTSSSTWMITSIVIQNIGMNISPKQFGRNFRVKLKLTNKCSVNITRIGLWLGGYSGKKGLGYKEIPIAQGLGENETIEISEELNVATSLIWDTSTLKLTFFYASNNTEANPFKCEVSNIELYQTGHYLMANPKVANGKNNSESYIDFTCNTSNQATQRSVPELRLLPAIQNLPSVYYVPSYTNPDPAMGATTDGGWDITSKPSSAVTKGNWQAPTNYISYLKNHETTDDLPEGVTSAIDIKTSQGVGYSGGGSFFHDTNWTTVNPFVSRFINKFKIKYSLWYRVNPNRTNTISGSYQLTMGVFYNKIEYITNFPDTEWHKLEGEAIVDLTQVNTDRLSASSTGTNDHQIALSWQTIDTTVDYAGSIADFQYTIEMVEDTFSPVICKLDHDTKSISNILVYKDHQRNTNLIRAKNHLTHF